MVARRNSVHGGLPRPYPLLHVYSQRKRPTLVNHLPTLIHIYDALVEKRIPLYTYTNIYISSTFIYLLLVLYVVYLPMYTHPFRITPQSFCHTSLY